LETFPCCSGWKRIIVLGMKVPFTLLILTAMVKFLKVFFLTC